MAGPCRVRSTSAKACRERESSNRIRSRRSVTSKCKQSHCPQGLQDLHEARARSALTETPSPPFSTRRRPREPGQPASKARSMGMRGGDGSGESLSTSMATTPGPRRASVRGRGRARRAGCCSPLSSSLPWPSPRLLRPSAFPPVRRLPPALVRGWADAAAPLGPAGPSASPPPDRRAFPSYKCWSSKRFVKSATCVDREVRTRSHPTAPLCPHAPSPSRECLRFCETHPLALRRLQQVLPSAVLEVFVCK